MNGVKVCFAEGCSDAAPFGVRFPGLRAEVPEKYRGYLWACGVHLEAAVARRDAAFSRACDAGEVRMKQMEMLL